MSVGHCLDDEDEKAPDTEYEDDNLSLLYAAAFHQSENPQAARTGHRMKRRGADVRPNFGWGKKSVGY